MKDPEFEQLILQTEESVIVANCAIIRRAAPKEWRAAAWLLERRRPDDYKLRQALDVTDLKDEQLLRLLERTAEAGSDQAGTDPGTESNQSTAESNPS